MTFGDTGFELLNMLDAELTEHDRSLKRYDNFGKLLDKFRSQLPKSNRKAIYRFTNK